MFNSDQIIIYKDKNGQISVDVVLRDETVWLNLTQLSELFVRDKSVISRHIKNILKEQELSEVSTVANFATVAPVDNSPSSKILEIWREITDLSRWNRSAIWPRDSQTLSLTILASTRVRPSSVW